MAFMGNPGTGKTTVARIVGRMYYQLGLLSKGHFTEVSRTDLIAGYQGQTALKVKSVIEKAKGGVLFIDEAYSITVLVVTSGIGLANAASATARALTLVDAPIVIAAGTTGGLARDINVGDIAVGTTAIYGQADATAFGYAMGQVPQMPVDYTSSDAAVARLAELPALIAHTVREGRIVSSDSFCTEQVADPMRERFPDAIGADMETCAMAQVCWSSSVDWISLRAVSDLCGPSADQAFHMDGQRAAGHSAEAVRAYLSLL